MNKALHYFNVEHWNCAESVYLAIFRHYYGIDANPKTATAYGGGIARTGNICGAINVAVMGISQKYGRENPNQLFLNTKRPVFEFLSRIAGEFGSIHCIELSGCNLSELEGKRKFRDENVLKEKCTPIIRKVMETFFYIVEEWKTP
ncbi:MAG: C-GCAxxG-C-C family protein [Candidatus Bathyarchaeota archaeon]|nr:C-GCAxxG-C-C family protein [Candidatus Bathyarchaeota archaeon]MDH5494885.1 C-GCAxxG-C-C family protein [Candidatus Bathyarchaeota archaeon]